MKFLSQVFTVLLFLVHSVSYSQTITDIVVGSPDHNTLEAAVIAADLATTLASPGPFTVFAPTDAAFAALGPGIVDGLLADPSGALTNVLLQHAVSGVADGSNIFDGLTISNLAGQNLQFNADANGVRINGINVSVANIKASNGVVHVIDAVLYTPPTIVDIVVGSPDHNTLEAAVIAADLAGTLSSPGFFTLFAPTDAAFAALGSATIDALLADPSGDLTDILLNHAVLGSIGPGNISNGTAVSSVGGNTLAFATNGSGITVNGVNITVASIAAGNGMVHVIDGILVPPTKAAETVLDIVVNSDVHNTLETAVLAAGLETALVGAGPFTVFAPTDNAFAAVDPATLNSLLADPQGALTQVLLYHVVSGVAATDNIFDGMKLPSLQGQNLDISINANGAFINGAQIIVTDIKAKNGVVHVIDAVLVP